MPYTKPGVEITQVQGTASPILTSPALDATVVGQAYSWLDINSDEAVYATAYSGVAHDISVSGNFSTEYHDITDADLVIVDLLATTGASAGESKHLVKGTDFSVSVGSDTITLNAGITIGGNAVPTGEVRVGFRSSRADANEKYHVCDSLDSITSALGSVVSWNPAAYGTYLCQLNASATVSCYATTDVDSTATLNNLGLQETYALAFLDDDTGVTSVKTHVEAYSNATNKKERVAFVNKQIAWMDSSNAAGSTFSAGATERSNTAAAIRDANSGFKSKRIFSTFPDIAYVRETRPLSTLKPAFIKASFNDQTAITWTEYNAYCELTSTTVANGVTYPAGTKVTDAVWTNLNAQNLGDLDVFAPVPGSYYCAANAGLLISQLPEQPLTNLPIAGIAKVHGSQDHFSEENLNSMAAGGTYIMTQDVATGPVYSRHQVSTNITSVALRELSVTKAVDYTAKFLRKGIKPYIGVNVISPAFLKLLNSVVVSQGLFLVRNGVLNDFKVAKVEQDTSSLDTINIEVSLLVKYPVNYIKIKLVF